MSAAPDTKPSPGEQLKRITDGFLTMATACEKDDPARAKLIREHVAACRVHYAELDAALILHFGRSLEDRDVCTS